MAVLKLLLLLFAFPVKKFNLTSFQQSRKFIDFTARHTISVRPQAWPKENNKQLRKKNTDTSDKT